MLGAIGGFLYFNFIRCNSSCAITGNPYISTLYGAGISVVLFNWKSGINSMSKNKSTLKKKENTKMHYGFQKTVDLSFEDSINIVTEELKKEGFGILTTIDVKETLKIKIDVDFKKYTILGACNPALAHKALQVEEEIGLLLPCNVIVYEKDGKSAVSVFDPSLMFKVVENENLNPIAEEVKEKLLRVFDSI